MPLIYVIAIELYYMVLFGLSCMTYIGFLACRRNPQVVRPLRSAAGPVGRAREEGLILAPEVRDARLLRVLHQRGHLKDARTR